MASSRESRTARKSRRPAEAGVARQKLAPDAPASTGWTVRGRIAILVGASVLVGAVLATSMTLSRSSRPLESGHREGPTDRAMRADSGEPISPGPQTAAPVPAASLMMGGNPAKEFNAGPPVAAGSNALKLGTPAVAQRAGLESRIALDPVCEMMAPPQPRLPPGNPAPGTRRMAARLAEIREKAHPASAGYLSERLADLIRTQLTNASGIGDRFRLKFQLAIQEINSARPDAALNTLLGLERMVAEHGGVLDERTRQELRVRKALAYFRLGEQENCLATHNADSCLFPLRPKAYHLLPRGSHGAIALLREHLAEHPKDLGTRWLLNLAHMTLGEYPDQVSPDYLIPPETFASEHEMPRFVDVSDGLGMDLNDLAGGCIVDDFDQDGFYDVVASAWDLQGQLRYFRNNGDGTFTDRTSEAGLVGEVGALNIQQTDYNNDGWPDIWMLRGAWLGEAGRIPNSLLRNDGDGKFTDVTEEAGLLSFHPTQTSRWFDFDGDGWLDLFVGNESTDPRRPHACELYRNNRDGTFTECAKACGIHVAGFVKGVACGDYDNDGRPDLYLSVRSRKAKILLHNDGPDASGQWRFHDAAAEAGVNNRDLTFGTFFFDYDNDGWEDLIQFGYYLENDVADVAADYLGLPGQGEKTRLYRNNRNGTFTDVTVATRMNRVCHTMGHNYGDLDNDGWLDFYCGTGDPDFRTLIPNRMFRNAGGRFFQDVTTATGTGHLQKGHGVAFADLDDDGDQDVYCALGGAYSGDFARNALFLNPGNSNRWLKLTLVGTKANRPAIGARLRLTVKTPVGSRELHRVVSSGGSFGGNPLRQEIGLGDATAITAVNIVWPGSGHRQTVTGLELNRSYQIREDDPRPAELALHPVRLERRAPTAPGVQRAARP